RPAQPAGEVLMTQRLHTEPRALASGLISRALSLSLSFLLMQPLALPAQQQPARPPAAGSPQQQPAAPADNLAKFSSSTQLVVEIVSVKDKSGNIVEGLTAKDFTVTENGQPQTISFCEFQKLDEEAPAGGLTPRGTA